MQYAIELYFDKATEEGLFHLSKRIAEEGISTKYLEWKVKPHLTLACFNDVDEERCAEKLMAFAASHKAMPAHIGSVGMFPDTRTIFVSPIMNSGMYQFHRELHECMREFDTEGWEWYCPYRWVPHCTIALTKDDGDEAFYRAGNLVLHEFQKLSGEFVTISLGKVVLPAEELFSTTLGR